jgi:hypothetical protein
LTRGGSSPKNSSPGRQLKIKVPFPNWGMQGGYCNLKKVEESKRSVQMKREGLRKIFSKKLPAYMIPTFKEIQL